MPPGLRLATLLVAVTACDEGHGPPPIPSASPQPSAVASYDPEWRRAEAPLPSGVVIETTRGVITCRLDDASDRALRRRFGALARGEARYRTREGWQRRRAYDGSAFDRAAAGVFVVARPLGAIAGPPGAASASGGAGARPPHDTPGTLSIGPDGEIALTAAAAPPLDATMTPIGRCRPREGIDALTRSPTKFGRPLAPPRIVRLALVP